MEKYKKGGYTILDLESSTIHADSVKALESNKPVVVYDGTNKPYFADTISLSGTSVVITKGGKTITIANDNTITNVGDIQEKLHLYAIDFMDFNSQSDGTGNTIHLCFQLLVNFEIPEASSTILPKALFDKLINLLTNLVIGEDDDEYATYIYSVDTENNLLELRGNINEAYYIENTSKYYCKKLF